MRIAALALTLVCAAQTAIAQQPSIVGTWEWTRKSNNCTERYAFRDDGNVSIESGSERLERAFRLAWSPEPNGRYKLSMTTKKDSGGAGCADSVETNTARQSEAYVLFGGSRETMLICSSLAGADCIGPLRRTSP